jgi:amino acid adenylation domain-containing protein
METRGSAAVEFDPFATGEILATAPSTEAQREIWTSIQLGGDPANCAYNEAVSLRLHGPLDEAALERALGRLVERHEALRSTFSADGVTLCVLAPAPVRLTLVDLCAGPEAERESLAAAHAAARVREPFDLERGPLLRADLLRLGSGRASLLLIAHHIVCDGWSTGLVLRDLGALYAAECTGAACELEPAPAFSRHASAESERIRAGAAAPAHEFWLSQFPDVPAPLDLPVDYARPPLRRFEAAREDHVLAPALVDALKAAGRRSGASLFATLLCGFEVFLARLTGQSDLVVGVSVAGQPLCDQNELVGHCVSTLPLRSRVDLDAPFAEHLSRRKRAILDAFDQARFTFGTLLRSLRLPRDPSRIPLVPVLFNLDAEFEGLKFGDLDVEMRTVPRAFENFEWFLNLTPRAGGLVLECTYHTHLFSRETIRARLAELETLYASLAAAPGSVAGDLALLPDAEKALLLEEWNATQRPYDAGRGVHALIGEQASRRPEAIAVRGVDAAWSYAELEARSNQIARYLVGLGARPGQVVGLLAERRASALAGLLGILKTGAAYLPLDPEYPAQRLAYMLEDAGAQLLVRTSPAIKVELPVDLQVIDLETDAGAIDVRSAEAAPFGGGGESLAYVIYTSGSTGRPKGVEVPHRAVVNFVHSMAAHPGVGEDDSLLAVTTLAFDIAVLELLLPLCVGARVTIATREQVTDGQSLAAALEEAEATLLQATPATWRLLIDAGWNGDRKLRALCGGEALPADLAREIVARVGSVFNMYGPTETAIWSSCAEIADRDATVSIGRPIANTRLYVLDPRGQPVPRGVAGELYIGGEGVTHGYRGRSDLTAERFVEDRFAREPGRRLYRTGDLVRWRPDGNLQWLARIDQQVKIRGFRIELGEIEAALASHPGVRAAAVAAFDVGPDDRRLSAYVVAAGPAAPSAGELRRHLASALPPYMVPQHFSVLSALPLTPNGKLDRAALPRPEGAGLATRSVRAPAGKTELALAQIWSELLKVEPVGADADFFEIGGHSLLAARMLARVRERLGCDLPLRAAFEQPTLAALAGRIEAEALGSGRSADAEPLEELEF